MQGVCGPPRQLLVGRATSPHAAPCAERGRAVQRHRFQPHAREGLHRHTPGEAALLGRRQDYDLHGAQVPLQGPGPCGQLHLRAPGGLLPPHRLPGLVHRGLCPRGGAAVCRAVHRGQGEHHQDEHQFQGWQGWQGGEHLRGQHHLDQHGPRAFALRRGGECRGRRQRLVHHRGPTERDAGARGSGGAHLEVRPRQVRYGHQLWMGFGSAGPRGRPGGLLPEPRGHALPLHSAEEALLPLEDDAAERHSAFGGRDVGRHHDPLPRGELMAELVLWELEQGEEHHRQGAGSHTGAVLPHGSAARGHLQEAQALRGLRGYLERVPVAAHHPRHRQLSEQRAQGQAGQEEQGDLHVAPVDGLRRTGSHWGTV
mmetsp:Transcript_35548/g.85169  ORF Transcript_35548/g.85169 Transcript_35548/m.85169 type:complete len:369 (+) Transcript_35548:1096-2202(+)